MFQRTVSDFYFVITFKIHQADVKTISGQTPDVSTSSVSKRLRRSAEFGLDLPPTSSQAILDSRCLPRILCCDIYYSCQEVILFS